MKQIKIIFSFFVLSSISLFAQDSGKYDIMVTSAAVPVLYRGCANDIFINVPDLCSDYQPECTATNANIIQNSEMRRKFRVVPSGKDCTIAVANKTEAGTIPLGNLSFRVIEPPKPEMTIKVNGANYTPSMMVGKGSQILIQAMPDEHFEALVPNDAQYAITSYEIYAQTGLGVPQKIASGVMEKTNTNTCTIPLNFGFWNSGIKFYIEYRMVRINYKGERVTDTRFSGCDRENVIVVVAQ